MAIVHRQPCLDVRKMDKVADLYHTLYTTNEGFSVSVDVREQKGTHLLSLFEPSRPLKSMSTCRTGGDVLSRHFGLHRGV